MNDFAYGQTLMFYKDDVDSIRDKYNKRLIIEQDGATCHKSKKNTKLLNSLFGQDGWIQNPPNSPDLAYPIEDLWAILKPRVKRREPSSVDELKKFLMEEWYSIPPNLIQNLCKNYLYRINKVIELNGARLEPEHLKKEKHDGYKWEKIEELPRVRMAYNEKQLGLKKAKEISKYKAEIKLIKKDYNKKKRNLPKYKKKDLKNLSLGRALTIINEPKNLKDKKDKNIGELESKINMISKMTPLEYLKYLNDMEKGYEDDDSTIDEIEEKISQLNEFTKENKIKYQIKF